MKILDRYITKTLLKYSLSVMVVLVSIFAFFKFLEEVNDIGRASYTLLDAIIYIGFLLPKITYEVSSVIILLGAILGLGHLAANSELIVMRSSGISIVKITKITLRVSISFVILAIILGEFIAPLSSNQAQIYRAKALGETIVTSSQQGFWIRDKDNFIHVERNLDGKVFNNVTLIKKKSVNLLDSVIYSDKAIFDKDTLTLQKTNYYLFDSTGKFTKIKQENRKQYQLEVAFDQDLIDSLKKDPSKLSTVQLFKHMGFLSKNGLSTGDYEAEFYKRTMKPITLVAMILLVIPFIFGSLRDASLGKRIFLGIVISLIFHQFSQLGVWMPKIFNLDYFLSASLPTLIVLIFALLMLYRTTTR
mgnify:CR=1 FL=1